MSAPDIPTTLFAPRLGKAYDKNPVLSWRNARTNEKVVLVVRDQDGKRILRRTVSGTRYEYPSNAPALEPGRVYSWWVEVRRERPEWLQPVAFLVVPSDERARIEESLSQISSADPYERGLARARVFTRHRLWYDAIAAYTDLIGGYPDRAELYEERGMIYAQLYVTKPLAEQDFDRADQLQSGTESPKQR